jgi:hypothetical protein
MLFLLFLCSAVCTVAGAVMIGFGIPVKEFSFGNTLISSGVTAVVGGLVLFGLGLAVVQLQRIMEALSARAPMRAGRGVESFEPHAATGARAGRVPFPSRPKPDARTSEILPVESVPEAAEVADTREQPIQEFAPTLHNPDEPPMVAEDANAPLSPQESVADPRVDVAAAEPGESEKLTTDMPAAAGLSPHADVARDRDYGGDWRPATPPERQPQSTFFDSMWPADQRLPRYTPRQDPPRQDLPREDSPLPRAAADHAAPAEAASAEADIMQHSAAAEARTVAILKSGVVDGMSYTLYVDGSIEAELSDGKLRFASINELRSYLEKNS